jgi:hypothetical protein
MNYGWQAALHPRETKIKQATILLEKKERKEGEDGRS